jgi:hypothetical protein
MYKPAPTFGAERLEMIMGLDITLRVDGEEVFQAYITHNLTDMAKAACIYGAIWRPDEYGFEKPRHIKLYLTQGLVDLLSDPYKYEKFNPQNGWGSYDYLVNFVKNYIIACSRYPDATIEVCR